MLRSLALVPLIWVVSGCTRTSPTVSNVTPDAATNASDAASSVPSWKSVTVVFWVWDERRVITLLPTGSFTYTFPAPRDGGAPKMVPGVLTPHEADMTHGAVAWLLLGPARTWSANTTSDSGWVVELDAPKEPQKLSEPVDYRGVDVIGERLLPLARSIRHRVEGDAGR